MEALRIEEVELFGENGGRIVVSADLWAKDPDKIGIAMKMVDGDGRAMFRLDDEETLQLRAMIEAQLPKRRFEGKGISFRGSDGAVLSFRPSNMGEPYREGFDVCYGIDNGDYVDYRTSVFIQDREVRSLAEAIDRFVPQTATPASPHR